MATQIISEKFKKLVPRVQKLASKQYNPVCLLSGPVVDFAKSLRIELLLMTYADPLLRALHECEARLHTWIQGSPKNASLFQQNPAEALRAANLNLDEDLLCELQTMLSGIARKINAA